MLKGHKISEEGRRNISEAHKGYCPTMETRQKLSIAMKNRVRSEKEIQRLKEGMHKGFKHSEETRKKMSIARRARPPASEASRKKLSERMKGEKHPLYGTHPSEETLKKLRESHLGKKRSPESLLKLSQTLKGHPTSEETRRKIAESNKGKPVPSERREKISKSLKGRFCGVNSPTYGSKSPLWKGGTSFEPYCHKFNDAFKERVRAFFGYQCVECGSPQNGMKLHVHHIQSNKETCCDDSPPLFVPLCKSCHGKAGHNLPYWELHFTEIINNYYQGRSYLTQEEMMQLGGG